MFAEAVNEDKDIVESVFVLIEAAVINGDMFPRSRGDRKRLKEARFLIPGHLNSSIGMTITAVLLD